MTTALGRPSGDRTGKCEIMASTTVKEIMGDVRFALTTQLKQQYPNMDGAHGFLQTTEAYLIRTLYGIDPKELPADYYIAPGDGGGPIMVEIGEPDATRWDSLASTDGTAVRVLHVGLDRKFDLFRPRHTEFETDLLNVLAHYL